MDTLLMLVPVFVFLVFLFWSAGRRRVCPACGERLPNFQSPFTKTPRQWFEGGYVCPACGCEADARGREVPPGTGPRAWAVAAAVLAVVATTALSLTILFLGSAVVRAPAVAPPVMAPVPAPVVAPPAVAPGR